MSVFGDYLSALRSNLARGDSTEHTHRPAFQKLIEAFGNGIVATNEPRRTQCGAPDFKVSRAGVPLGHIETKDVGTNLSDVERGRGPHAEQFQRYKAGLPNWVLTNYLDFHWFVNGQRRMTVSLAKLASNGKLTSDSDGETEVAQLLDAFLKQEAFTIGTAKDLAEHMAHMTRLVRDQIIRAFDQEKDKGWLHTWLTAFREVLIPDLDEPRFADMFAQTLSYGLFAARVHTLNQKDFTRERAAFALPKTNPFLRKLFSEIAGVDMPETIEWAVTDLVDLLRHASMSSVLKDFGKGKGKEDPVVHFYETFLSAYDPKMRELRGVYYTPEPVVSYIVHSVDHLLKTRFNRPKGLADENTLILDPAVGTATFLYFVVQQIYQQFSNQKGAWDSYVSHHLLNRIFGFELLMAPYSVAHLKLGMQLQETGYKFASEQRLGIFLTNTLEEAAAKTEQLMAKFISDEANAAAAIKRDLPILVVLGNPPYSGHSANRSWVEREVSPGEHYAVVRGGPKRSQKFVVTKTAKRKMKVRERTFIGQLVDDYYYVDDLPLGEKNPKWLQDDYVKFIRFAQWRIEKTGEGVLAFITNNGYLDNPTFRGMRQSLMRSFSDIQILNLHGSSKKREETPDGGTEENVFDIQQGVAILLCVKERGKTALTSIDYADLWGARDAKYEFLDNRAASSTEWREATPAPGFYSFVPTGDALRQEYETGWKIAEAFPSNVLGFQSHRDDFAVSFDKESVEERVEQLRRLDIPDEDLRQRYSVEDNRDWHLASARESLRADADWEKGFLRCLYRPFDVRWCYFSEVVMDFPRRTLLDNVAHRDNLCLGLGRQGLAVGDREWYLMTVSRFPVDANVFRRGGVNLFPAYLYGSAASSQGMLGLDVERVPNLSAEFLRDLSGRLKLPQEGPFGLPRGISPELIFGYAYACFHAPSFRHRYAEFLTNDFPRLPLTSDRSLFSALASKGAEIISLHLTESPKLNEFITSYPEKGGNTVEAPRYSKGDKRAWINASQYFEGVPQEVWEFHIGGYQVCEKWLKDRRGRQLSYDDIQHYQKVVVALNETIRLMGEVDALIPGWPLP
jgi:predicted helicase